MEKYEKRLAEIAELVGDYDESEVDFENDDIDSLLNGEDDEEGTNHNGHNDIPTDVVDWLIEKHTGEKRVKTTKGKSREELKETYYNIVEELKNK